MTFFSWVILIGILLFVGLLLKRNWETQQQTAAEMPDTTTASGFAAQLTSNLQNSLAGVRSRIFRQKQPEQAAPFRAWAKQAMANDPMLTHWLDTLADGQVLALAEHIAAFCREMGFDLDWLIGQEIGQHPKLEQALSEVVALYCRACHQSVGLQAELEIYKLLRAYLQNPNLPYNREFGQALFGKMLEQGITSINVADHMALPEHQRRQQIVDVIRQAAQEKQSNKQAAFRRILNEVVAQRNASAVAVAEPPPAPVSVAATNGTGPHKIAA